MTVVLTATDDASGVAHTYYSVDGAAFVDGTSILVDAPPTHVGDGVHTINYYSVDGVGNTEATQSGTVSIDTTVPQTEVWQEPFAGTYGVDALWHRTPVTLGFGPTDPLPALLPPLLQACSGIQLTQYKIDIGGWTTGTRASVKAPTSHSWDGVHTVSYGSTDNAGNVETTKSVIVRIDTKGPACSATNSASAVQASYATLRYRVIDAHSPKATVTISVKSLSGSTVKTYKLGPQYTNKALTYRVKCGFSPKTYRYYVYAVDQAGNKQSRVGVNTLTVKPGVLASLSASVNDSTPAQYTDVTVSAKAKDQAGHPLSGVKCVFTWHYKTTTPRETHTTGSTGIARCTRYISGSTAGYRVSVTVVATYHGVTRTAETSSVPH